MTPEEHLARVREVAGFLPGSQELVLPANWNSLSEAKLHLGKIRVMQKELRLLKKGVITDEKVTRSAYLHQRVRVGTPSIGQGLMKGLFGVRNVGKLNTLQRESLRQRQTQATQPYQAVKCMIDQLLIQLDRAKLQIEMKLAADSTPS